MRGILGLGLLLALGPVAAASAQGSGSATLDAVRARGAVACGVAGTTPGFSFPDSKGLMRGADADICRAVAAAALGDASKVKFVPLTSTNRFTALQSGEVDMLARGVTWTLGREASQGLLFTTVSFYDGTGFLVKASSGVKSVKELDGATICVLPGTSTELAITDYFRQHGMKFTPVLIDSTNELRGAFLAGRCDAYSTDASSLAGFRFSMADVRRLLGLEGDLGQALGVDNGWAYAIVKQVGNTGEVWDRDIAPLGITRGQNAMWGKDGLLYAPPLR